LPFWQTTVVVLPGGTTTVVFCGGGFGFELLMQPANKPAATMAPNNTFICSLLYFGVSISQGAVSVDTGNLGSGARRMRLSSQSYGPRPRPTAGGPGRGHSSLTGRAWPLAPDIEYFFSPMRIESKNSSS
jgi:hypothetical protein